MPERIKITFLGTGGSIPTIERGLPAMSLEYNGAVYLFDCGEGTQMQMLRYGVNAHRIRAIFITHMHGDHVIGVAGLIRSMALYGRTDPLEIFVPDGEEGKLEPLLTFDKVKIGYPILIRKTRSGALYKGKDFTVSAFALKHSVKTFGYRFKEDDRLHFDKQKCAKLGIKKDMFTEIQKKGKIMVGKKLILLSGVTTKEKGRSIVYATDSRPTASAINASKGADILVHEATYSKELAKLAKERAHSTSEEAAKVAKSAGVSLLVIFHVSARYSKVNPLEQEAKKVFKNTMLAYDGMELLL
jgi:ribonuclease Z